jgi:hypothetical protein
MPSVRSGALRKADAVNVYADHNILIYCIKHPRWGYAVAEAHRSGKADRRCLHRRRGLLGRP